TALPSTTTAPSTRCVGRILKTLLGRVEVGPAPDESPGPRGRLPSCIPLDTGHCDISPHVYRSWPDAAARTVDRALADAERDAPKQDLYRRLAEVEDRHVTIWADLLRRAGRAPKPFVPSARARLLAILGRTFGPRFLLPMLLAEEGREVRGYLSMHRSLPSGGAGKGEALLLARESAEHASTLGEMAGRAGEPWHRAESGGFLRNVVYGFNDGLTANFGLVAGMIGATARQ